MPTGSKFKGPIRSTNGFMDASASFALKPILSGTIAVDPASISANSSAETAVTITGVAAGDIVIMNVPASLETGLAYSGVRVSAANTVQVRLTNATGSGVDGTSRDWTYLVLRPDTSVV
jgi:hypothetical protein